MKLPLVSHYIHGLMSVEDKIKLDNLPASITGTTPDPLSSSIQRTHQFSASYAQLITATINRFSASQMSASNVDFSTGTIISLSSTKLYVYDLIVQNSNLTGTGGASFGGGPITNVTASDWYPGTSSYAARQDHVHGIGPVVSGLTNLSTTQLSATHISGSNVQFSTATITRLSASIFSASNLGVSTGTFSALSATKLYVYDLVVQNSNISGSSGVPDPLSSSIQRTHEFSASYELVEYLTATHLTATRLNFVGGQGLYLQIKSDIDNYTMTMSPDESLHIKDINNDLQIIPNEIYFSAGITKITNDQITSSYFVGESITVTIGDFSDITCVDTAINSSGIQTNNISADNLTSSNAHILTGTFTRFSASQMSASNAQFSTATFTRLSASMLSASNAQFSTATFSSLSSSKAFIYDLVAQNTNITASIPDPLSSSIQRTHQFSASYAQLITATITRFSASQMSASNAQFSTATFDIISSSNWIYATQIEMQNGAILFDSSGGSIFGAAINTDGADINLTGGDIFNVDSLSSSFISCSNAEFSTATFVRLSASMLSASNAEFSTATFSSLSSSKAFIYDLVAQNTNITASIPDPLSSSVQRAHQFSASYAQLLTATITRFSASQMSASNAEFSTATFTSLSSSKISVKDLIVENSNITSSFSVGKSLMISAMNLLL